MGINLKLKLKMEGQEQWLSNFKGKQMCAAAQEQKLEFDLGKVPTLAMGDMRQQVMDAFEKGKYSFIIDMNGNAATYWKYQGMLFDFYTEVKKCECKAQDRAATVESLRYNMVEAMRFGQVICVNFENRIIKMNEWKSDAFDPEIIMDDEKYDNDTRTVTGTFHMSDRFQLVYMTES